MDTCETHLPCVKGRREEAPDVSLCRASAAEPVGNLQYFHIPFITLSQLDFDLSLTSTSCCALIICQRNVCSSYTETTSFYMVKKRRPSYSAFKNMLIFSIYYYISYYLTCLVWSREQRHQFHLKVLAAYLWANRPGLVRRQCVCHGVASLCIPFHFVLFRPEANRSALGNTKRTKAFQFSGYPERLHLCEENKNYKNKVAGQMKAWEEEKKKHMRGSRQNGQAALEHRNQIFSMI